MKPFHITKASVIIVIQLLVLSFLTLSLGLKSREAASETYFLSEQDDSAPPGEEKKKDFIRWVDFTVPAEIMEKAFRLDINTCQAPVHLDWIELLAFLGARYGGDFSRFRQADLDSLAEALKNGTSMDTLAEGLKYYPYYKEAYGAVLGGMVGYFEQEAGLEEAAPETAGPEQASTEETGSGDPSGTWVTKYGLKAFSPIARDFPYSDYDDFGVSRSYGYKRRHLGHDMMGQVGTPIIAVESGTVEALGWNQYGGWRIGIRSFDKKRYYYYAHLRKNYPYHKSLKQGSIVQAGDVIGYLGRTGYSTTENTNNIDTPHLHFGLQLIFDESQAEENEIWINAYEIVRLLSQNKATVERDEESKEYYRKYDIFDPIVAISD